MAVHRLAQAYGVLPSVLRDLDAQDVAFCVRVLNEVKADTTWRDNVRAGGGRIYSA